MPFSEEEERVRPGDPEFFPCINKLFFHAYSKILYLWISENSTKCPLIVLSAVQTRCFEKKIQFPIDTETGLKAIKFIPVNQYAFS